MVYSMNLPIIIIHGLLQLFGSENLRSIYGYYDFHKSKSRHHLCGYGVSTGDHDEGNKFSLPIERIELIETFKSRLNLHHEIGTLLKSKQVLLFKGK